MKHKSIKVVCVIVLLFTNIIWAKAQDTLSPSNFQQAIANTPNAVLVDVRTAKEYSEGHLPNAHNIDVKGNDFIQKMDSINHDTPLYLYCLAGSRSDAAAKKLKAQGFTHIKQLSGGYLNWKNNNLPIEQATSTNKDAYTQEDLQKVLKAHDRVLVDFGASWCGPCLVLAPKIKKLEKENTGKLYIQKINVDDAKELTQSMNVRSIPLLVLFENGKPVKALEGNQSMKALRAFVQ